MEDVPRESQEKNIEEAELLRREFADAKINQAEKALKANDLDQAQQYFMRALEATQEDPSDTRDKIRQTLKARSDEIIREGDEDPTKWQRAHKVLDLLDSLKLQDEETPAWRYHLWMDQADFHLEREELDKSFEIFSGLLKTEQSGADSDALQAEISRRVRSNILREAEQSNWPLLNRIVDSFKPLRPTGDELNEWLETISHTLKAMSQDAEKAQQERRELQQALEQTEQQLHQEQRSRRNMRIAVVWIVIVAVIIDIVLIVIQLPNF
jgi:uncharacterized membrane protein